jgi:hypothetical protein
MLLRKYVNWLAKILKRWGEHIRESADVFNLQTHEPPDGITDTLVKWDAGETRLNRAQ